MVVGVALTMMPALLLAVMLAGLLAGASTTATAQTDGSIHFYGTGSDDIDRVKIRVDGPSSPIDVAGDFTLELWLRAEPGANLSGDCQARDDAGDGWINGNIVVDRDIYNEGDHGDYGLALYGGGGGTIAFGVAVGDSGRTLCGGENVADGRWHHVAATRAEAGDLRLFVDGRLVAEGAGAPGDMSYRDGRGTDYPGSDPYLVLGAEKHDAGSDFPSFNGWLDELRVSSTVRYPADFQVPAAAFEPDGQTVGLFHMDEGGGDRLGDSSAGATDGEVRYGGPSGGPTWDIGALAATAPTTTAVLPDTTGTPPTTADGTSRSTDPVPTGGPTSGPTTAPTTTADGTSEPATTHAPSTTTASDESSAVWPIAGGVAVVAVVAVVGGVWWRARSSA
jgi:hypothetical protein